MTPVPRITCKICPGLLPPFFHPRIKLHAHGGGRRPGNEASDDWCKSCDKVRYRSNGFLEQVCVCSTSRVWEQRFVRYRYALLTD